MVAIGFSPTCAALSALARWLLGTTAFFRPH